MEGINLIENFITEDEEAFLLSNLAQSEPKKTTTRNSIRRYGSSRPYNSHMASKDIPDFFNFIVDRALEQKLVFFKSDSITVNEYLTGQNIEPHIDSLEGGPVITILSLLNEAEMVFHLRSKTQSIILPRRSLIQMSGEARTLWKHSIKPVVGPRYSIVLRCTLEKNYT